MIARDHAKHLAFSPLQTAFAKELLKRNSLPDDLMTVVLLDETGAHIKSRAIFKMFPYLGFPLKCLGPIGLVVSTCLDPVYSFVGRNRSTVSKYWRKIFSHDVESHTDRMLGLQGMTVAQATSSRGTARS